MAINKIRKGITTMYLFQIKNQFGDVNHRTVIKEMTISLILDENRQSQDRIDPQLFLGITLLHLLCQPKSFANDSVFTPGLMEFFQSEEVTLNLTKESAEYVVGNFVLIEKKDSGQFELYSRDLNNGLDKVTAPIMNNKIEGIIVIIANGYMARVNPSATVNKTFSNLSELSEFPDLTALTKTFIGSFYRDEKNMQSFLSSIQQRVKELPPKCKYSIDSRHIKKPRNAKEEYIKKVDQLIEQRNTMLSQQINELKKKKKR